MSLLDFAPDPKRIRALKFFLIATLVAGALGSAIARPLPVPIPFWAIAPLWTFFYGLMAVAGWLAWKRTGLKSPTLALYAAQLALGLVWRALPLQLPGVAMDMAVLATLILFARGNWLAALTFLPCAAWILFISVPTVGF
jgi:tryptophan-rich sensory protein